MLDCEIWLPSLPLQLCVMPSWAQQGGGAAAQRGGQSASPIPLLMAIRSMQWQQLGWQRPDARYVQCMLCSACHGGRSCARKADGDMSLTAEASAGQLRPPGHGQPVASCSPTARQALAPSHHSSFCLYGHPAPRSTKTPPKPAGQDPSSGLPSAAGFCLKVASFRSCRLRPVCGPPFWLTVASSHGVPQRH